MGIKFAKGIGDFHVREIKVDGWMWVKWPGVVPGILLSLLGYPIIFI